MHAGSFFSSVASPYSGSYHFFVATIGASCCSLVTPSQQCWQLRMSARPNSMARCRPPAPYHMYRNILHAQKCIARACSTVRRQKLATNNNHRKLEVTKTCTVAMCALASRCPIRDQGGEQARQAICHECVRLTLPENCTYIAPRAIAQARGCTIWYQRASSCRE